MTIAKIKQKATNILSPKVSAFHHLFVLLKKNMFRPPSLFVALLLATMAPTNLSSQKNKPAVVSSPPQKFTVDASPSTFTPQRLARLDSMMQLLVTNGTLPNVVTFVAHNGTIVHHKAYGYRNIEKKEAATTTDIYRMASQTKAITSAALMTLYEEGRFLLDDPISKYITEFANPQVLVDFNDADTTYTTRAAKGEITIRHLLSHQSGIHYGILGGGNGGKMYAKQNIPAVNSLEPETIEQVVKKIAKMPLMFDPGEKYMYGMNTDVVGYLIEILSGQKLDAFIAQRILKPLGMNDTYFYLPKEKANRLVTLYSSSPKGLTVNGNVSYQTYPIAGAQQFLSGGAGLCGPIGDYAKFCQMMLNKGTFNNYQVLSRKTVELMITNQLGDKNMGRNGNKFGLGFELFGEQQAAHHLGSKGAFKWGGMYYTDYLIDPNENLIMLIYTNVQPYRGPNVHELFQNLVYQALK
jgi:CubicO group peptidase (beta-lactamase class C family)